MRLFEPRKASLLERIFAGQHNVLAALRSLRRSPAFVAIAVISLGLAIGLNTTTFALIDTILHQRVPYARPEELYEVTIDAYTRGQQADLEHDMYMALRQRDDLFNDVVPWSANFTVLEVNNHLERGSVNAVHRGLFRMLGVQPAHGRFFNPDRDDPADATAAILT